MTKQQYLDNIIPVIHKANPKIVGCVRSLVSCGKIPCKNIEHYRSISLEHVLKAMNSKNVLYCIDGNTFTNRVNIVLKHKSDISIAWTNWSLGLPLSDQPLETLQFIHSILCDGKQEMKYFIYALLILGFILGVMVIFLAITGNLYVPPPQKTYREKCEEAGGVVVYYYRSIENCATEGFIKIN